MKKSHYSAINKDIACFNGKKGNLKEMIKKSKKLKDMEERLKNFENKCEAYHSLEPNLGATIQVIEKKEELLQLEEDIQKLLQAFENS